MMSRDAANVPVYLNNQEAALRLNSFLLTSTGRNQIQGLQSLRVFGLIEIDLSIGQSSGQTILLQLERTHLFIC